MNILQLRLPLSNIRNIQLKSIDITKIIAISLVPIMFILFLKLSSNFSIVGLLDVYDKRDAVDDMNLGFLGYVITWLANFIVPILIAKNWVENKYKFVLALTFIYVFLFFTLGNKLYLVSIFHFALSYLFVRYAQKKINILPWLFSFSLLFPFLLYAESLSGIQYLYSSLVNMRTFAIQGLSTPVYVDFFSSHQYTYFSHITGVNAFIDYPYQFGIPIVMENYYGLGNYNAPYFMSDGYSSLGYLGMIIVGVIVSCFFYCLDCLSRGYSFKFVALSFSFFTASFLNVSFATSMITFGGAFFLLFYLFYPISSLRKVITPNG
ncbi:hypothetical protein [Aliikangiella sp. IMCC44359]|uniref:hypothetical protein n=1 Tax=Aliikangiella sp. IMCC44359 TaxID=3459125 RepID=UPI00403AD9AE